MLFQRMRTIGEQHFRTDSHTEPARVWWQHSLQSPSSVAMVAVGRRSSLLANGFGLWLVNPGSVWPKLSFYFDQISFNSPSLLLRACSRIFIMCVIFCFLSSELEYILFYFIVSYLISEMDSLPVISGQQWGTFLVSVSSHFGLGLGGSGHFPRYSFSLWTWQTGSMFFLPMALSLWTSTMFLCSLKARWVYCCGNFCM